MGGMPDVTQLRKERIFTFTELEESAELAFNQTARKRIREIGVRVVYLAYRLESYPQLQAADSRRMAKGIAEEATHARQRLRSLIARLDEAFMCGLPPFAGMDELERRDSLAQAMHVAEGIASDAERLSAPPRRGGRRPRLLLKELAWALYGVYRNAGGTKGITCADTHKRFHGLLCSSFSQRSSRSGRSSLKES